MVELKQFDVLRISLDDYQVTVVEDAIDRDLALARELEYTLRDKNLNMTYATTESGMLKNGDNWMDEVGYFA